MEKHCSATLGAFCFTCLIACSHDASSSTGNTGGAIAVGGSRATGGDLDSAGGSGGVGGTNVNPNGGAINGGAATSTTPGAGGRLSDAAATGDATDAGPDLPLGPSDLRDATSDAGRETVDTLAVDGAAAAAAFKGVANSSCAEMTLFKTTWYYDWMTTPEDTSCKVGEFVPMIWGHTGSEQTAAGITSAVANLVAAGRKEVLGFNEPDNSSQSNLSVATAISLWPSFNNPAIRIGSPATQANTTGVAWMKDFMNQVNADTTGKLRVDFIAVHWYGWNAGSCDKSAATLEAYLKQIEAIPGNRPLWITEFGCMNQSNPDVATVQAFFQGALAVFAKHPRIERYAWYPWNTNNELVTTRTPTPILSALGTDFAAAPPTR